MTNEQRERLSKQITIGYITRSNGSRFYAIHSSKWPDGEYQDQQGNRIHFDPSTDKFSTEG